MATAVIVGNGQFPKKEYPLYLLESADYVVCCDGALDTYLRHFRNRTLRRPDVVIGDMDSLSKKAAAKFITRDNNHDGVALAIEKYAL